jgi:8-oxo-dGTP diphosphatase
VEFLGRSRYFIQNVLEVIFRHPVTAVSIFALNPENQIILTKRRDNQLWGLPGGMVKWGEDISTTAKRELLEETGLDLIKINRLIGVYSDPDRDPRLHSICIAVEVSAQGNLEVSDRQEISEVQAFPLNHLLNLKLAHDHNLQLQDYLNGAIAIR